MARTPTRYHLLQQSLHWLMALLIVALWTVGNVMDDLPKGPFRAEVFAMHKGFGVLILFLVPLRLALRRTFGVPALPATMRARDRALAHLVHLGLYGLMTAMPLAGIFLSQAGDHPVVLPGFTLPTLIQPDHMLKELFEDAHGAMGVMLAVLVAAHAGAALFHHFRLRDEVLRRMLPWAA